MKDLTGKTAVITGAASGIGFGMAERFAAEGMKIVLADIEETALEQAEKKLRDTGTETLAVITDVSQAESVEALKNATIEHFGAVHLVCNNAGVGSGGPSWQIPLEAWKWVLGVNMWGIIHGIHYFVPLLIEQGEGHVVNTASLAGLISGPLMSPYNASKHAAVAISESLHHELLMTGSAVHTSVLCPGWVNTNIFESERNWLSRLGEKPVNPMGGNLTMGKKILEGGLQPSEVANMVHDAVVNEKFWILTHPEMSTGIVPRFQNAVDGVNPTLSFGELGAGLGSEKS